ncbi:replicative DNA helicase [bacterium]|nr:replicative DNA helicase [bacterium]
MAENLASILSLQPEKAEKGFQELPHNIDAEQALLGILLIKNDAQTDVGDFLRTEHFYEPVHQKIYAAVLALMEKGHIANPVTLKHFFDKDEALAPVGGADYLHQLAANAGMLVYAADYAKTIYDLALKRALIDIGETVVKEAYVLEAGDSAFGQIERAEQQLFTLATVGQVERSVKALSTAVAESIARTEKAYRNAGRVSGCTTGFIDMDRLLGGFQDSDLIILAGRPSMGKTALATSMACEAAKAFAKDFEENGKQGKCGSVGFFSLEMSAEQLAGRLLAGITGLNSSRLRRGELNEDDFAKMVEGSVELSAMPLYIDDTPAISISALRTRARRMKRQHNLSLLVVDYLQLLRGTSAQAATNRVLEITEITQGLKAIAKELNIPVIALSQLSRAVEQREDKRPQLSDLRESGSIEQDADVVMFVFREEYYLMRSMPREDSPKFQQWQDDMTKLHGIAEVIIAKQRHGPIGNVRLAFHSDTTRFANYAGEDMPDMMAEY